MVASVLLSLAAVGCGDVDGASGTTEVRSALQSFGPWQSTGDTDFIIAPTLAANGSNSATLMGYGLHANGSIWGMFWQGTFWAGEVGLPNSGAPFTSSPAAVGFNVTSGPLVNHFAIVAMRADNKYYIQLVDRNGNVDHAWTAIGVRTFATAPSIAFVPASSATGPKNSLVLVGVGTDGRMYWSRNTLAAGNTYNQANWTVFAAIGTTAFISAPAIAFANSFIAGNSLVLAGGVEDVNGNVTFMSTMYNGTSWSAWTNVLNGTFISKPALAVGMGEFSSEITIYGEGLDNRLYVSTQLSGGAASFSVVGNQFVISNPSAVGIGNVAWVSEQMTQGGQLAITDHAFSPE